MHPCIDLKSKPLELEMKPLELEMKPLQESSTPFLIYDVTLRFQVPNNHVLTQSLYYNYYYPKPKYLMIGYLGPRP